MQPTSLSQFGQRLDLPPLTATEQKTFKNRNLLGFTLVILAGVSYALQGILGKWSYSNGANVPTLLTIRYIVAGIAVWAIIGGLAARQPARRAILRAPRRKLSGLLLLGALWVPNSLFFFLALELIPASTASLLVFVFPAMVVLWQWLFFGEQLTRFKVLALIVAILGCCLTVDPLAAFSAGGAFSWLGVLLAFGSAFSNSWYSVLAGRFGRDISALTMSLYVIPVAAVLFTLYTLPTGSFRFDMSLDAWLNCLIIALLTGFSIVSYLIGVNLIGASRAAISASSEPASSIFMAALLLAEPLTFAKLAGGLMILMAILLLTRRK